MSNAALAHGVGVVLVGNLPGNDLESFRVYAAPQPRIVGLPGASLKNNLYEDVVAPTASESSAFAAYRDLYVVAGGSLVIVSASLSLSKSSVGAAKMRYLQLSKPGPTTDQVSVDGNIDAFDVVSTPVYREQVASRIFGLPIAGFSNAPNTVDLAIVRVLNYVGIGKIISSPITLIVHVRFADGTTSNFHWDSVASSFVYTPGSSKDGSGNPIPENEAAAAGAPNATQQRYLFPGNVYGMTDGINQIDNLNHMGISIGIPTIKAGSSWMIACTFSDGHSHCVAQPQ